MTESIQQREELCTTELIPEASERTLFNGKTSRLLNASYVIDSILNCLHE